MNHATVADKKFCYRVGPCNTICQSKSCQLLHNCRNKLYNNTHTHTHARTHARTHAHAHAHVRLMALFGTTQVSRYQKSKINLDFTEARVAVASAGPYASLHLTRDRQPCQHATTQFLQAGCPSRRPTNSIKALKFKYSVTQRCLTAVHGWAVPSREYGNITL